MLILDQDQLKSCVQDLIQCKLIDHDTETTGLFAFKKVGNTEDPGSARIAGHAFLSSNTKNKYYIPIRHETIIETDLIYSLPPQTSLDVLTSLIDQIEENIKQRLGHLFIHLERHITGFSSTKSAQAKRQNNVKIRLLTEAYLDDHDYNIKRVVQEVVDALAPTIANDELWLKYNETHVYEGCISARSHEIKNLDYEMVSKELLPLFNDPERTIVGFNYKFDLSVLRFDGIVPKAHVDDVMVMCHLSQENEVNYQLKDLARKYVDPDAKDQKDFVEAYMKKWKLKRYSQVPADLLGEYAEKDVELTHALYEKVLQDIAEQNLTKLDEKDINKNLLYKESLFLRLLDKMWWFGIPISPERCQQFIEEADKRCAELIAQARELLGFEINLNSQQQVCKVIGTKSAAKDVLEKSTHPLAKIVLEYRAWGKVRDTYYKVFLRDRDENNKLHPDLFQIGTVTGRLSCRNPNFQALPREKDDDDPFAHIYKVKHVVVPLSPDYAIVTSDLSQAEMRVAAHYAKELRMIEIIKAGGDLHTQTALAMFGEQCIDPKTGKPTKEYRNFAKRLNFGIIYGMGADALAQQLKCSHERARELLNQYHESFPGFKKLYNGAQAAALRRGWIKMWTGRRRRFYGDTVHVWESRKAMNNLIQGTVSEMMKLAMLRIDELLARETNDRSYIFNQVHDALWMMIHREDWHLIPQIRDIMQDNFWMYVDPITGKEKDPQYAVPIITDTEFSLTSYGELQKWYEGCDPWAA